MKYDPIRAQRALDKAIDRRQIAGAPFIGTNAPSTHFQCPDDIPAHRYEHCTCGDEVNPVKYATVDELWEQVDQAGQFISEHHMEIDTQLEMGDTCEDCESAARSITAMRRLADLRTPRMLRCWCARELLWFPCGSMCALGHDPLDPSTTEVDEIPF